MPLMQEILNTSLGEDELLACFLGQDGFIFRTRDLSVGVDLYLSDSCANDEQITQGLGVQLHRALPIYIPPQELNLNLILATHEHKDHADPDTLLAVRTEKTKFVGPWPVIHLLSNLGFPSDRCLELDKGQSRTFGSATIRAVFARHVAGSAGYLLELAGLKIYMTGDTEFDDRLLAMADYTPDILMVCINGRWGNMSSEEAVELQKRIRPKVVVPVHYDMFAANSADPIAFAEAVASSGVARPRILESAKIYRLTRATL